MGRNKEPVDLILAKGKSHHISSEELEKRRKEEIKAKSDCILIPEFVPEHLKDRFLFISQQLQDIGIMSNLDVDCLGRYVCINLMDACCPKEIENQAVCIKEDIGTLLHELAH